MRWLKSPTRNTDAQMDISRVKALTFQLQILIKKLENTNHQGRRVQLLEQVCEVLAIAHAYFVHFPKAEPAANSLTNNPT